MKKHREEEFKVFPAEEIKTKLNSSLERTIVEVSPYTFIRARVRSSQSET
jgi:hypothetical protein